MALKFFDRVKETSTTTGAGAFTLAGAVTGGFVTFASVLSVADTCYYCIQNTTASEWEVGLGTYSAANTLTRTTPLASSNGGAAVNFSAGTKDVFLTSAAAWFDRLNLAPDDTPVDGELAQAISSNWAFDHVAAADPHPGYMLESNIGTGANNYVQLNASAQLPAVSAALLTDFPTFNQNTSGSAGSVKSPATTGKVTITGPDTGTTRAKTVRDADDTILELGGSYTPTGTWNFTSLTGTWPTFNQNTSGSAESVKSPATTGKVTITGPGTGTTRVKTVRDADDTILELGGSYTPTGTWNFTSLTGTWPTFNQNTSGTAAGLTAQYIDWNAVSGGASIANKPVIGSTPVKATGAEIITGTDDAKFTTAKALADAEILLQPSFPPFDSGSTSDFSTIQTLLTRNIAAGTAFPLMTSDKSSTTYSLVFTSSTSYAGGVLALNGDIHFVPYYATVGQKISPAGTVSTYSMVYTKDAAWFGGVLAPNGDIHFIPFSAAMGQKINSAGTMSTYSLVYTLTQAYAGGVLAPNGDIYFIPNAATVGQKINSAGTVSTYSLIYTVAGACFGGVLAPNGDIHFVPNSATVGQKINSAGTVSTYSLIYTVTNAYRGGVLALNGDIHFVPSSATVGQKINSAGTVSTYSLVYTLTDAYFGGVLAPNGDIHFVPSAATVGQKINSAGTVSTYSLTYTVSSAYRGGVLASNGDVHFVPLNAIKGQKIVNFARFNFPMSVCTSSYLNKL